MYAFEKGGIDKLPHHPFAPSLEELENAIDRRKVSMVIGVILLNLKHSLLNDCLSCKATLIEKVQADDRVKKLEYVSNQERVTIKVRITY